MRVGITDGIGEADAVFLAAVQRLGGRQLLACETSRDVLNKYIDVKYDEVIEFLFGRETGAIVTGRQLVIDAPMRTRLIRQIAQAKRLAHGQVIAASCRWSGAGMCVTAPARRRR